MDNPETKQLKDCEICKTTEFLDFLDGAGLIYCDKCGFVPQWEFWLTIEALQRYCRENKAIIEAKEGRIKQLEKELMEQKQW